MSSGGSADTIRNKIIWYLVAIFLLGGVYEADKAGVITISLPTEPVNTVGTYYEVDRVVDGDTIRVRIGDTVEPVRLIGINTPESVDPRRTVECFGKEASARMKELAGGKIVRLEYDDTQGVRDTYNRLLAYVYLEDGQMLNRKMVAEGYAYEYTYLTPYLYQKEFREAQKFAQSSGKGLWAKDSCDGKK